MKKRPKVTIIRYSCLTGKAVWVYRGPSKGAACLAYWRACKAEIERVHHWSDIVVQRADGIRRLLTQCMADKPIDAELTAEQKEGARQLMAISKKPPVCDREFYDHIMEERRRRAEDREIRRQMRERENLEKQTK